MLNSATVQTQRYQHRLRAIYNDLNTIDSSCKMGFDVSRLIF